MLGRAGAYLRAHWRGELPLATSFWVNFAAASLAALTLGEVLRAVQPLSGWSAFSVTATQFVLFWLVLYPWQLLGVLRASERAVAGYQHGVVGRLAPLAVLAALGGLPAQLVGLGHDLHQLVKPPVPDPVPWQRARSYALALSADGTRLRIAGFLDFGVTREVRALVEARPAISTLVLSSGGGPIYEARMLANIVARHGLDTLAVDTCSSACTLVFAAGSHRQLGPGARLGFHRYRLDASNFHPYVDIAAEQRTDLEYLAARGVDAEFLKRVFERGHDDIWFPTSAALLTAGMVHALEAPSAAPGSAADWQTLAPTVLD